MRTPPLLADFSHARVCKPFCENFLTLPVRYLRISREIVAWADGQMESKNTMKRGIGRSYTPFQFNVFVCPSAHLPMYHNKDNLVELKRGYNFLIYSSLLASIFSW